MPLKSPPKTLNLPGGVKVRAFDFRITRVDAQNRPVAFELAEAGTPSDCVLWAADHFVLQQLPPELLERFHARSQFQRGPKQYFKTRSLGPTTINGEVGFDTASRVGGEEDVDP